MKKKLKYRKLIKSVLIIVGIVLLVFFAVKKFTQSSERWVGVDSGYISLSSNHKGLIITDEIVYKTLCSGYIVDEKTEGQRIKKSQLIANFISSADASADNTVNNNDESSINPENDTNIINNDVSIDKNQVKLDANNLYGDLKTKLKNHDNKEAREIKRNLSYTLEHLKKLENKTIASKSIFNENEKYVGSKDAKIEQIFNIISSESGVISYYIDDLAGDLKYEDRYNLNYQKLFNEPHEFVNNIDRTVNKDEKLLRLIYKQKWHLLCESTLEDLDTYKIDGKLSIYNGNEKLDAVIVDKFKSKDIGILCLEISQVSDKLNNSRLINVTIESDKVAGVKIPPNAIVSENYIKGVYIRGLNDERIFRPIQILGQEDEYTIVSEGSYTYRNEDGSVKTVDTVNRNDKVLVNVE